MEKSEKLFADFAPTSKENWKAKAIEDLNGADFEKKLVWKTDNGFPVQPFYTSEDVLSEGQSEAIEKIFSGTGRNWVNYININVADEKSANKQALQATHFGASGFLFHLHQSEKIDFQTLLNKLDPGEYHISFTVDQPSALLVQQYFDYLQEQNIDLSKIRGFVDADILEQWMTEGKKPDFKMLADMLTQTKSAKAFSGLTIKSASIVNAGGSTSQELALMMNKLVDCIDQLHASGLKTDDIVHEVVFNSTISGDYFFEIAKLRALRIMVEQVLGCYGADTDHIEIIATNAYWSKSLYDPYVNMLRNTTEAMSAIIGGCDAVIINPHDSTYKPPNDFSHRIALNVSNLLRHEAYLDKVVDPAAGSYYLENLTRELNEWALSIFRQVEDKGGLIKAFESNYIQKSVAAIRDTKLKEMATRKRVIVGTNKYPNLNEQVPLQDVPVASKDIDGLEVLTPMRMGHPFEALRQQTQQIEARSGKVPKVYLAGFGNLAMRKARAGFATEFFGIAGFEIMGEFFFDSAQKAAQSSAESQADIVVICSSDPEYEEHAAAFAGTFKNVAPDKYLVLAGYPAEIVDKLQKEGVDTFIHMKSDAISVLQQFQDKLLPTN